MLNRIAAAIERYRMFERGQRVGVAVSGGADSVCLLHALLDLAPRWDLRLRVLHLDHGLRGEESRGDAAFVAALAERLSLPAEIRQANLDVAADNLEQAAREARLQFFGEAMARGEVDRVAVGHTRSDQAETVLFRFLRGAGTAGLAGIRPAASNGIVRPLIDVERADVERFLRERGIAWREDSTNRSPQFARNRIRHQLLPQLAAEWNPSIAETLAHTADWALAEEAYWEAELERICAGKLIEQGGAVLLPAGWLRALAPAAGRRVVRRAMERVKGDLRGIDFPHVEAVLDVAGAAEGHGRMQAAGLDIFRSFDWIRFGRPGEFSIESRDFRRAMPVPGRVTIPGNGAEILTQLIDNSETSGPPKCVYNKGVSCIDWARVSGPLEVRTWRPGDQYQPVGHTGEVKIKNLFHEARIPLWERRYWPVLTDGSSIVWTRRFGPAAGFAAGPASGVILQIREEGIGIAPGGVYKSEEAGTEVS